MPKNIDDINKILIEQGKEPLKAEVTEPTTVTEPAPNGAEPNVTPSPIIEPTLTDDAVLNYLKNKGLAVNSFEDLQPKLVTQADLDKQVEQEEAEKISWALRNGKVTAKKWQGYASAVNDKSGVVYSDFRNDIVNNDEEIKQLLITDPIAAEQKIKDEFEDEFSLNADPNSLKYKRGQQKISVLADKIIQQNYGEVLGVDSAYSDYRKSVSEQDAYNKKILAQAPVYKREVEEVFNELTHIPFDLGDGEVYKIAVQPEMKKDLLNKMLENGYSEKQIANGWTKGELADIANTALLKQNYNFLAKEAAKQYHLKRQAGSRGIPLLQGSKLNDNGRKELTEAQKQILNEAGRADLVQSN